MKVRMEADPKGVAIKPLGRLGDTVFRTYLEACRGAEYDARRKCNVASVEVLPGIVERLQQAKFDVEVLPDVAAMVSGAFAGLMAWSEQARERVERNAHHLYPYQRPGAIKLASRYRFLLADEMGLGKTRQAIFATPEKAPVLVVCPSIAKGVWRKEFEALRPEFDVRMLSGRGSFRWPRKGEVIVVNYDILPAPILGPCVVMDCKQPRRFRKITCSKHSDKSPWANPDHCLQCGKANHEGLDCLEVEMGIPAPPGLVLIADEAHGLKSRKARRTQAFHALSNVSRLRRGYVWLLTGTPLLNRPSELWELLLCADLAREAFGDYDTFAKLYNGKKGDYGGYVFPKSVAGSKIELPEWALVSLGEVMLRRSRQQVMPHLPPKSYSDVDVDLSRSLKDDCDEFVRKAAVDISDPQFLEKVPFKEVSRLRAALATAKIPSMREFVDQFEEQDEPLIVFSAHKKPVYEFADREGWATITGETHTKCRASVSREMTTTELMPEWRACKCRFCISELFRHKEYRGVAGSIEAMGVGIRFERAMSALFVDLEWTPGINQQAEDRLMGVTQERAVTIYRLIGDHKLERRVAELCAIKSNIIAATIHAARSNEEVDLHMPDLSGFVMAADTKAVITVPSIAGGGGAKRRGPHGELEQWAAKGLVLLAGSDEDRAKKRNAAGFGRFDSNDGHSLVSQLHQVGLTDLQWRAAVKMCRQYWRQIGAPPE